MGIDIDDRGLVTVNQEHNYRVVTSTKPPVRSNVGGVPTYSIFRRLKARDDDRDGNPLIHALKGKRGYFIRASSLKALYDPFCAGIATLVDQLKPETLIAIPSSSNVNAVLLKRILRQCPEAAAECECFEKLSIRAVLDRAPEIDAVKKIDRQEYGQTLRTLSRARSLHGPFEMKLVSMKVRPYFSPIGFRAGAFGPSINGKRVVLIEDILASGTTLMRAKDLLMGRYQPATLTIITLLSGL